MRQRPRQLRKWNDALVHRLYSGRLEHKSWVRLWLVNRERNITPETSRPPALGCPCRRRSMLPEIPHVDGVGADVACPDLICVDHGGGHLWRPDVTNRVRRVHRHAARLIDDALNPIRIDAIRIDGVGTHLLSCDLVGL